MIVSCETNPVLRSAGPRLTRDTIIYRRRLRLKKADLQVPLRGLFAGSHCGQSSASPGSSEEGGFRTFAETPSSAVLYCTRASTRVDFAVPTGHVLAVGPPRALAGRLHLHEHQCTLPGDWNRGPSEFNDARQVVGTYCDATGAPVPGVAKNRARSPQSSRERLIPVRPLVMRMSMSKTL
jgi:hypothetical protein